MCSADISSTVLDFPPFHYVFLQNIQKDSQFFWNLLTLVDTIFGKGKSSLMLYVMHGDMLNTQDKEWSQIFAQASFSCIVNNIPKTDPLFKKENVLQILTWTNAKVQDILKNYFLIQIMGIFDQSSQFKDCFCINEIKLILKNFCWLKFGFKISIPLSLSNHTHSSSPTSFIRKLLDSIVSSLHLSQERK